MILKYIRNIIGIIFIIMGLYLTIFGILGSWGILIFVIGLYMIKRINNE